MDCRVEHGNDPLDITAWIGPAGEFQTYSEQR